jgi:hypothetical protein
MVAGVWSVLVGGLIGEGLKTFRPKTSTSTRLHENGQPAQLNGKPVVKHCTTYSQLGIFPKVESCHLEPRE